MSSFVAFLWWCWIIFLLSIFAVVLFPIAIFIALMIPVLFLAFLFW
jgi:hypothetical protein